jgi:hypothetical protein
MVHARLARHILAALAIASAPAAVARAQPRGVAQEISAVSGIVEEVERAGRLVTIRVGNTVQAPIYAGPDMPVFDQLNRGDLVTIRFYDAFIVEITPGARMAPLKDTTTEAQQKLNRPDAAVVQQVTLVVTVDTIDPATGMVTYHGVDNRRVQRLVQQRQLLEGVKAGDVVTIRQTRAQAVGIEKR